MYERVGCIAAAERVQRHLRAPPVPVLAAAPLAVGTQKRVDLSNVLTRLRIAVAERVGAKDDCLAASDELTDDRWPDREGAVVRVGVMTFPGGRIEDGAHREVHYADTNYG